MSTWPDTDARAIRRHLQRVQFRNPATSKVYRSVLLGFQRFVLQHPYEPLIGQPVLQAWLRERAAQITLRHLYYDARVVDGFMDFLLAQGSIATNPLAELRSRFEQPNTSAIVRALLAAAPEETLEALRPLPRFASFLGGFLRDHIELKRALGYRYRTEAGRFLRFDRFLQSRPDLAGQPPAVLVREWTATNPAPPHAWECQVLGRDLAKAWRRVDPHIAPFRPDGAIRRQIQQRQRRPYLYTQEEIRVVLETARRFPSPYAPLRPLTVYTMLVLAYCAGLRVGEIVRLDLSDVDLEAGEITIRDTKFFKSRTLPLTGSVVAALREYLEARRAAGAPQQGSSGLFWHEHRTGRYSRWAASAYLVAVLRRAGLKPDRGRVGPRVHDLRHAFVANRMLAWYREGINPQQRLPYLATYLGHKDINSTLVYLTVTQELMQQASERFRAFGAHTLHVSQGA